MNIRWARGPSAESAAESLRRVFASLRGRRPSPLGRRRLGALLQLLQAVHGGRDGSRSWAAGAIPRQTRDSVSLPESWGMVPHDEMIAETCPLFSVQGAKTGRAVLRDPLSGSAQVPPPVRAQRRRSIAREALREARARGKMALYESAKQLTAHTSRVQASNGSKGMQDVQRRCRKKS